jgi:Ca2+-binding RTX toxin-like protein
MTGGAGNDTFDLTNADGTTDTITDWGLGTDILTGTLASSGKLYVTIDNNSTTPFSAATAAASNGQVSISGGTGADDITGGAGADTLLGNSGADSITGGAGADNITGGTGADNITGGAGADTYKYTTVTDNGDSIAFSVADIDVIDLSAIASLNDSYGEYATTATDITANNNIIVFGTTTAINIDTAATAIAADATVTGTTGYIVIPDGNSNTLVYHTTNLGTNGTETLMLTLTGVANASTLTSSMFLV